MQFSMQIVVINEVCSLSKPLSTNTVGGLISATSLYMYLYLNYGGILSSVDSLFIQIAVDIPTTSHNTFQTEELKLSDFELSPVTSKGRKYKKMKYTIH